MDRRRMRRSVLVRRCEVVAIEEGEEGGGDRCQDYRRFREADL